MSVLQNDTRASDQRWTSVQNASTAIAHSFHGGAVRRDRRWRPGTTHAEYSWSRAELKLGSRPHQQQRIGAERHTFPGGRITLGKTPGTLAAGQQELIAVEAPRRQAEIGDRGIAALLYDQLVFLCAVRCVRQRERTQRLVELAQQLPIAEQLIGAARLSLHRRLGLHEEQALAFPLPLVHAALDLVEFKHRSALSIDQRHHIVGSELPDHDILQLRE